MASIFCIVDFVVSDNVLFEASFLTGMGIVALLFAGSSCLGKFVVWAVYVKAAMAKPVKTAPLNMQGDKVQITSRRWKVI